MGNDTLACKEAVGAGAGRSHAPRVAADSDLKQTAAEPPSTPLAAHACARLTHACVAPVCYASTAFAARIKLPKRPKELYLWHSVRVVAEGTR